MSELLLDGESAKIAEDRERAARDSLAVKVHSRLSTQKLTPMTSTPCRLSPTSWRVAVVMFAVASFFETIGFGHYYAFMPLYLQALKVPQGEIPRTIGMLSMIPFTLGLPLVPFWGVWADRYSRKLIIVRSAALEALVFGLMGASHDLIQFAAAVAVAGLALGNTGVMLSALTDLTPRNRLGFALAVVTMAGPLGFAIGPAAGGFLADSIGIPTLFFADAGLVLSAGIWIATSFREEPRRLPRRSTVAMVWETMHSLAALPMIRLLFLLSLMGWVAYRLVNAYVPVFVGVVCGGACRATDVGIVMSSGAVATALLGPVWGILGDRVGHARLLVSAATLASAGFAALALAHSVASLAGLYMALGMVLAGVNPLFYALLATRVPAGQRSAIMNLVYLPLYLGGISGPAMGAALMSGGAGIRSLFFTAGALMAIGALIAVKLARTPPYPQARG